MVELKSVSLGYDGKAVLSNINLKVISGKILGIVGPNGSGKSTLIKGMSRLVNLFSGRILVGGRDIGNIKREELACLIATVPQNPTLPEAFTAFEVVLMGRTPHLGLLRYEGEKDATIAWEAMNVTKTQFLAERRIGELSGGERQRLVIARALTQQPKVLLLDEPTANLDIRHQIEALELVRSLCSERDLIVITALHDLNLAAQYCDWLVMLNEGQIYTEGIPQDVLTVDNIKKIYGARVCVYPHPINKLPTTLITAGGNHAHEDDNVKSQMRNTTQSAKAQNLRWPECEDFV